MSSPAPFIMAVITRLFTSSAFLAGGSPTLILSAAAARMVFSRASNRFSIKKPSRNTSAAANESRASKRRHSAKYRNFRRYLGKKSMSKKRQKIDKRQMMPVSASRSGWRRTWRRRPSAREADRLRPTRGVRVRGRLRNELKFKACECRGARRTSEAVSKPRRHPMAALRVSEKGSQPASVAALFHRRAPCPWA